MTAATTTPATASQNLAQRRTAFIVLLIAVGAMAFVYLRASFNATGLSYPVMPLDDTYIHFQYARVLADGHFMQYNPGQPPTSGATSFMYPAILAAGYKLGFTAERLAWWALIIGVLSWIGSAWLVYLISRRDHDSTAAHWIALAAAVLFVLTGSLGWAFMSGMETGLTILLTLLIVYYVVQDDREHTLLTAALAALVRPEMLAIAILAAMYFTLRERSRRDALRHVPLYVAPILFGLVQPLLNAVLTGSATASGMIAKSYLYNVPTDTSSIVSSILHMFGRALTELATGFSPDDGLYFPFLLSMLALVALIAGLVRGLRTRRLPPELLMMGMVLAFAAAVSILETAFWQLKRYQQPMIALLFPLAAWGLLLLVQSRFKYRMPLAAVGVLILLIGTIPTTIQFVNYYADNVREVATSQLRMAQYVDSTLPPDAIVAVHDIGVMRYLGNRATYDVIGLSTPGAAVAWRNGPGAVYEQMLTSPWKPDYLAIYTDARSLNYLADTELYKNKLAEFPSTRPTRNIASATSSGQAVYKPDWTASRDAAQPLQPSSIRAVQGMSQVDSVNVANLANEAAHSYRWWQMAKEPGFATELYELSYINCQPPRDNATCLVMDGGRLITGGEEMTIRTTPGQDVMWITRVHPRNAITIKMLVNGKPIATRVIPTVPGQWLELATLIPASEITGTTTRVRVEANISDPSAGFYMPYYHWFYQGTYHANDGGDVSDRRATFGQSTMLLRAALAYNSEKRAVALSLSWRRGNPAEDVRDANVFIHVIDAQGNIVAQLDQRPGGGTLPPANWLPGPFDETYTIPLPAGAPAGTYRVMMGLYDPLTFERWPVVGDGTDEHARLLIGSVDIPK